MNAETRTWLNLQPGQIKLQHAPEALQQYQQALKTLTRAIGVAYIVFWLMVMFNPAIQRALLQAGLSGPAQWALTGSWLLSGLLLSGLLWMRWQRLALEKAEITPEQSTLYKASLWGLSRQQLPSEQLTLELHTRLEIRQANSGPRQRWVQELQLKAHDKLVLRFWLELQRFSSQAQSKPVLPEAPLKELAQLLQQPIHWVEQQPGEHSSGQINH